MVEHPGRPWGATMYGTSLEPKFMHRMITLAYLNAKYVVLFLYFLSIFPYIYPPTSRMERIVFISPFSRKRGLGYRQPSQNRSARLWLVLLRN